MAVGKYRRLVDWPLDGCERIPRHPNRAAGSVPKDALVFGDSQVSLRRAALDREAVDQDGGLAVLN